MRKLAVLVSLVASLVVSVASLAHPAIAQGEPSRVTAPQPRAYASRVELLRSSHDITAVDWRIVDPSGDVASIDATYQVQVRLFGHDDERIWSSGPMNFAAGEAPQGMEIFDPIPEQDVFYVQVYLRSGNSAHSWDRVVSSQDDDTGIISWGGLALRPLKLKVGQTTNVSVSMKPNFFFSARERKVFVGDASILGVLTQGARSPMATLSLKGLRPGKTTLRLFYYDSGEGGRYHVSGPRDVWVTDEQGDVPETGVGG